MNSLARVEREWDYANGLVVNLESDDAQSVLHAPHMLVPSPFPKKAFDDAVSLARPFNDLYFNVASDSNFLYECLDPSATTDTFTKHLLDLQR